MMSIFNKLYATNRSWNARKNTFAIITFIPAIILLFGLFVIPTLFTLNVSLYDATVTQNQEFIGTANFINVVSDNGSYNALVNGTIFAVGSVFVHLILGLIFALLLNRDFKWSLGARISALFPYLIPTVIVMTVWDFMLNPSFGFINELLVSIGIIDSGIAFFASSELAMPALIFVNSWKYTAFAVIIILPSLQSIDSSLYESAKVSGANRIQMFRDITLPNIKNALFLVVLLRTIWMFNHFDTIWLLTRGGPFNQTQNLPVFIYKLAIVRGDLGAGSAAALILLAILIIFAFLYFRLFKPSEVVETQVT
jgi:multiple sugar transport system permease protein